MPVYVENSSIIALDGIYYPCDLIKRRYQSEKNGRYEIFLTDIDNEKIWIFADINPMKTCYYIHYYHCKFNRKYHQMFEFCQYPPCIGWINIAAPNDTVTICYKPIIHQNIIKQIKLCIYAKKIVVKPKHIINNGYLLVNGNNKICEVGQINKSLQTKINNNKNIQQIFECDILCPGFVDIVRIFSFICISNQ